MSRPQCGRCASAKQACGGYDDSTVFIHAFQQHPRRTWKKRKPVKALRRNVTGVFQETENTCRQQQHGQSAIVQHGSYFTDRRATTGVVSLSQTIISQYPTRVLGFSQTFVRLFYSSTRRPNGACSETTSLYLAGTFASDIPSWTGHSKLLDTAILALATAYIGNREDDALLSKACIPIYSRALGFFGKAIAKTKTKDIDGMMAASLVMGLVELFIRAESSTGYQPHVDGGSQLLRARLPASNDTPFSNSCFLHTRHVVVRKFSINLW